MHTPMNVFNDDYRIRLFAYAWQFLMRSRREDPLSRESRMFLTQLWQQQQLQQDHVATLEELILRAMDRLKRISPDNEQIQQGLWHIVTISLEQEGEAVQPSDANASGAAAMPESPSEQTAQQPAVSSPGRREQPGRSPWFAGLIIGGTCMTAVLTMMIAFGDLSRPDHQPEVEPPAVSTILPTPSPEPNLDPSPLPSIEFEQPEKTQPQRDRVVQLGIRESFFEELVRDRSALAHFAPVKTDTPGAMDQVATDLLDQLQTLPSHTRSKLGSYNRLEYEQWLASGVNQDRLDDLANRRFYQLFPEMQGKFTNPATFGQIWFALAEEQLENARMARPRNRFRSNSRTDQRLPRRSGRRVPIAGIQTI